MSPKFAIITPCYNSSPYLREMIDSVLNQSYGNFVFYLIDDGSTDETSKIIDEYASKDSRIIAHHQANAGVSVARNYALDFLEQHNIDRVVFLDSDDSLNTEALNTISKYNEDIVMFGMKQFSKNNSHISCYKEITRFDHDKLFNSSFGNDVVVKDKVMQFLINQSMSSNIIKNIRFRVGFSLGEDLLFIFDVIKNVKSAIAIPDVLYNYRLRQSSLSHSYDRDIRKDFNIHKFLYSEFMKDGLNEFAKIQKNGMVNVLWNLLHRNLQRLPIDDVRNLLNENLNEIGFSGLSFKNFKRLFLMKNFNTFFLRKLESKIPTPPRINRIVIISNTKTAPQWRAIFLCVILFLRDKVAIIRLNRKREMFFICDAFL